MNNGWNCPNCGKAHAPDVKTCPEPARAAPWQVHPHFPTYYEPMPPQWPRTEPLTPCDPRPFQWPYNVTCGDPPGTVGSGSTGEVQ